MADIAHLAERSRRDIELFETQLPPLPPGVDPRRARQAQLAGGDDYELAFTASPGQRTALTTLARQLDLPLWRIGQVLESGRGEVRLLDAKGQPQPIERKGFDHFGQ